MPEMNGDQLADAIKGLVSDQRVIMVTGSGDLMDRPQGVDLVLFKPVPIDTLRQALLKMGT